MLYNRCAYCKNKLTDCKILKKKKKQNMFNHYYIGNEINYSKKQTVR